MSCNTPLSRTESNILSLLKTNNVIDDNKNIIDDSLFDKFKEQTTKLGLSNYGIDAEWISKIETGLAPQLELNREATQVVDFINNHTENLSFNVQTNRYARQLISQANRHRITDSDNKLKYEAAVSKLQELDDNNFDELVFGEPSLSSFFENAENNAPRGDLAKLLYTKHRLLRMAKDKLRQIENKIKRTTDNITEQKKLNKDKNQLEDYINGTELTKGLTDEIAELEKLDTRSPELIAPYIESEFQRIDSLINSNKWEDVVEATEVLNFISQMDNFTDSHNHPIYDKSEMFDEDNQLKLGELFTKPLVDWANRARAKMLILHGKQQKMLEEVITNNGKMKALYGDNYKFDYNTLAKTGLKDISYTDMLVMDISTGIFSTNGVIPQVMKLIYEDGFLEESAWAKEIQEKIDALLPSISKVLPKLSFAGMRGNDYSVFRRIYKDGKITPEIVQKYSIEFSDKKRTLFTRFAEKLSQAYEKGGGTTEKDAAYKFRNDWLNSNTITLDPTLISELKNDSRFAELSEHFDNDVNMTSYRENMIKLLGENFYKELVEEQRHLLQVYLVQKQLKKESLLGNKTELSERDITYLNNWEAEHSPIKSIKYLATGEKITVGNNHLHSNLKYNIIVPRRTVNGQDTGYYDSNFERVIEQTPELMEFYKVVKDAITLMKSKFTDETQAKIGDLSVPGAAKTALELMMDKDLLFYQKVSKSFRLFIDKFRTSFGVKIEDALSFAEIDTVTGLPRYKVNDSQIQQNSKDITRGFVIRSSTFLQEYNKTVSPLYQISKLYRGTNIRLDNSNKSTLLRLLQPYTSNITIDEIVARYGNIIPIGKILYNDAQHEVVKDQSFDLPKILKLYTDVTANYAARQKLLPLMSVMKKYYENIKATESTSSGDTIVHGFLNTPRPTRGSGQRNRALYQVEDWFTRVVLGEWETKNQYGITKGEVKNEETKEQKIQRYTKTLKAMLGFGSVGFINGLVIGGLNPISGLIGAGIGATSGYFTTLKYKGGKIRTKSEEEAKQQIDELLKTETNKDRIAELQKLRDNLGVTFTASAAYDNLLKTIRWKGLAFNVSSAITNFAEGQLANHSLAISGTQFPPEYIYTCGAYELMVNDIMRKSGEVIDNAEKGRILNEMYDVLQDASNELQKASAKGMLNSLKRLNPYYHIKKTEQWNQIPVMAAVMKDTTITDKDGNVSNLWDALELHKEGKIRTIQLKAEFRTEENIKNWEQREGQDYHDFKSRLTSVISNTHGDFTQSGGMLIKSSNAGATMMMYKTWLPREIFKRLAIEQDIVATGKKFKGRYRSHTATTAGLTGGTLGLLLFPQLSLPMFAAGMVAGKMFGTSKSGLSVLQELQFTTTMLVRQMVGIAVNPIARGINRNYRGTAMSTVEDEKMFRRFEDKNFSKLDYQNLKGNIQEMAYALFFIGLTLLAKSIWHDDDDDDKNNPNYSATRRGLENYFVNECWSLAGKSMNYLTVDGMTNVVMSVSLFKYLKDLGKFISRLNNFLEGNDEVLGGERVGQSQLWLQTRRTFLPNILSTGEFGFEQKIQKQFITTPYDNKFWGEEKKAKYEMKQIRAKRKGELINEGYDEKESGKQLNRDFHRRRKHETYLNQLQSAKRKQEELEDVND